MKFYAPKYKQLDLGLLRSSLDELDKTNRWVALGDLLPWTELEKEYNSRLYNQKKGAGNKPARMILGAMIIKHKLNLSDAETIEIIRESPYMQYPQFRNPTNSFRSLRSKPPRMRFLLFKLAFCHILTDMSA